MQATAQGVPGSKVEVIFPKVFLASCWLG